MSFADYHKAKMPGGMQGPTWVGWVKGFAKHLDDMKTLLKSAAKRGMPEVVAAEGDDTSLSHIGAESDLPRFPAETATQYGERLRTRRTSAVLNGNENAIVNELTGLGWGGIQVIEYRDWPTPPAPLLDTAGTEWWSRFWVIVTTYNGAAIPSGGILGTMVLGTGALGVGVGVDAIQAMVRVIKKRKPSHVRAVSIIFVMGGTPVTSVLGLGVLGTMVLGPGGGTGSVAYTIEA